MFGRIFFVPLLCVFFSFVSFPRELKRQNPEAFFLTGECFRIAFVLYFLRIFLPALLCSLFFSGGPVSFFLLSVPFTGTGSFLLCSCVFSCFNFCVTKKALFLCAVSACIFFIPLFSVGTVLCSLSFFDFRFFFCPLCAALIFFAEGREMLRMGVNFIPPGGGYGCSGKYFTGESVRRICFLVSGISIFCISVCFPFSRDFSPEKKYSLSEYSVELLSSGLTENYSIIYRLQTGVLVPVLFPERTAASILIESQMRSFVYYSGGRISAEVVKPELPAAEGESPPAFTVRSLYDSYIIPLVPAPEDFEYHIIRLLEGRRKSVQVLAFGNAMNGAGSYSLLSGILNSAGYHVENISAPEDLNPGVPLVVAGLPSFFNVNSASAGQEKNEEGTENLQEDFVSSLEDFLDDGGNAVFFSSATLPDDSWILRNYNYVKENTVYFDFINNFFGTEMFQGIVYDRESCCQIPLVSQDGSSFVRFDYPFWVKFFPMTDGEGDAGEAGEAVHPVFSGIRDLCFFWPVAVRFSPGKEAGGGFSSLSFPGGDILSPDNLPFDSSPFSETVSALQNGNSSDSGAATADRIFSSFYIAEGQRAAFFADSMCVSDLQEMAFQSENARFLVNCVDWLWQRDGILDLLESKEGRREK